MSASSLPIPEKCSCRCQFISAMRAIKALHVTIASVMVDLAALRRSALEDPEFAGLYAKHLKAAADVARPLLAEAMESYEGMISFQEEVGEGYN